ncbi:hypothetical protein ACIPWF_06670 [Paenarthrobacter sp. NPDC089989]|uniref:COG1470 family protein n=1 Tax=unclassified Paenarthrobacter TaxID=2634190 RepID=UPI0038125CA6
MSQLPVLNANFFRGPGAGVRTAIVGLLVVLAVVITLGACGGQGDGQGGGQAGSGNDAKGLTVALSPASRSVDQGQSVTYDISVSATGRFSGTVTMSAAGLPAGTTAGWSPASVVLESGRSAKTTLTISTSPTTPAGKSDFTVTGASGTVQSKAAKAQLHVKESKRTFGVTASLSGALAPGVSLPLDLQITNPERKSISVTNLSVAIGQVVRTPAAVAAGLPCSAADYSVSQYSGTYPLAAQPGPSSLSTLGVAETSWPRISMLDTLQLQDGCKGATVQLTYSGTGQGN